MKQHHRIQRSAAAALLLLLASTAEAARRWTEEFAANRGRPERIVVLPPISNIVRAKVTEAEPMIKETETFERHVVDQVGRELRALGYTVDTESLSPGALASDPKLSDQVRQVRERAEELMAQYYDARKDIASGRFSIGDTAIPLGRATGADGLLVLHAQSVIPSKGVKTMAVLSGGYAPTETALHAILFHAATGRLEAVYVGSTLGGILKDPEKIAMNVVDSTFGRYPAKGQLLKAKRTKKKAAAEEVATQEEKEPDEDEEAVVAEFEKLYASRAAAAGERTQDGPAVDARSILDTAPDARPEPTLQIVFAPQPGELTAHLRNTTSAPLQVSIDLEPWRRLEAGQELQLDLAPGTHSVLVVDESGTELARSEWVVGGERQEAAEIRPR